MPKWYHNCMFVELLKCLWTMDSLLIKHTESSPMGKFECIYCNKEKKCILSQYCMKQLPSSDFLLLLFNWPLGTFMLFMIIKLFFFEMQCMSTTHWDYYKRKRSQTTKRYITTAKYTCFLISTRWRKMVLASFLPYQMENMGILPEPALRRSLGYLGLSLIHIRKVRAAWRSLWKEMKV